MGGLSTHPASPKLPNRSPIWGSDVRETERGGWKREADQAPGGGDGVPAGPSLCRWGSRALVVAGGQLPPTKEIFESTRSSSLGAWSSLSLHGKSCRYQGPFTHTRADDQRSTCQFGSLAHELQAEMQ